MLVIDLAGGVVGSLVQHLLVVVVLQQQLQSVLVVDVRVGAIRRPALAPLLLLCLDRDCRLQSAHLLMQQRTGPLLLALVAGGIEAGEVLELVHELRVVDVLVRVAVLVVVQLLVLQVALDLVHPQEGFLRAAAR